jgi:hypothetical protein
MHPEDPRTQKLDKQHANPNKWSLHDTNRRKGDRSLFLGDGRRLSRVTIQYYVRAETDLQMRTYVENMDAVSSAVPPNKELLLAA